MNSRARTLGIVTGETIGRRTGLIPPEPAPRTISWGRVLAVGLPVVGAIVYFTRKKAAVPKEDIVEKTVRSIKRPVRA